MTHFIGRRNSSTILYKRYNCLDYYIKVPFQVFERAFRDTECTFHVTERTFSVTERRF